MTNAKRVTLGILPCGNPPCVTAEDSTDPNCVSGEGHGCLVYKVYLVYRELCHLVQYTCPIVLLLISGL